MLINLDDKDSDHLPPPSSTTKREANKTRRHKTSNERLCANTVPALVQVSTIHSVVSSYKYSIYNKPVRCPSEFSYTGMAI